jgi:hypothetical protein
MPQIGYRQWGLIPADTDPLVGQAYTARPPMMTALAVDKNSSLIFKLAKTPAHIQAEVEVTALSGEKCALPLLHVFSSPDGERFHPVQSTPWTRSQDGLFLVFRAQIDDPEAYLKFQYTQNHSLIVNKVTFSTL